MNEEIMRVLRMVEEGKISADKAKELIDALGDTSKNTDVVVPTRYEDKFLRVKVLGHDGDKVNVQLPIKVIKEIINVGGKLPISTFVKGMDEVDMSELMNTLASCLENESIGEIVDICSSEGDIVKVAIE